MQTYENGDIQEILRITYYSGTSVVRKLEDINLSPVQILDGWQSILRANDKLIGNKYSDDMSGFNGNDTLIGNGGNDKLSGDNGSDRLIGGSGGDNLNGGAGADSLQGDSGKDTLVGGSGNDRFVFISVADSTVSSTTCDSITDFVKGQDKIDLSKVDAFNNSNSNDAFIWNGAVAFSSGSKGEVRFEKFDNAGAGNDYTMVYIDNDVDTGAEMSIRLDGLINLTASDFIL